jgi:hypothetical protein
MTGGKNKSISVQPTRSGGAETHRLAKQHSTNFSTAQGQSQVTRRTGVDGIHGKTTGLIGSSG